MKVFVTTGCGNIIQGGVDMWTNNFIELVLIYLDDYYILVDSKKPVGWEDIDTKNSIVSQKIMLRDFPSSLTTSMFETKDELRELWPVELLELPTSWY